MNPQTSTRDGASIATRLLFWFLAISLIPCGILTAAVSYLSRQSVEISVHDRLMVISDSKTSQLEQFIQERRGDVAIVGQSPSVVLVVNRLAELAGQGKYKLRFAEKAGRNADSRLYSPMLRCTPHR